MPPAGIALLPVFAVYVHYANLFRATSREVRRLDSTTRSPVYAHFGETLAGLTTIRSFGDADRFRDHNALLLEANLQTRWADALTQRWLNFRFDQTSACLIGVSVFSAVFMRESLNGGLVGMMLVQLFSSVRSFRMTCKGYVNLEAQMTYAERVFELIDEKQEPPRVLPSDPSATSSWPSGGQITVRNACLRYRPGLPLALDDVSIEIGARERVGICGRTGSGKSTLTLALFRMVELASGQIELDGHNIAELGLRTLRRGLTIIPQDPVMFTGTLRDNLDPFDDRSDAELHQALGIVRLSEWVDSMGDGLQSLVSEGGGNMSVGQRQLICLARALLKRPKLLVLDEATASVDYDTDALIQKAIRSEFDCTVLTIAHRLHTILDSDRIIVLSEGHLIENGPPARLMALEGGHFRAMVEQTETDAGF